MSSVKKRLINKHMKHRETTADRNYVIAIEAERSASAHKLMQDVVMASLAGRDQQGSESSPDDKKEEEVGDVIPPTPTRNPSVAGAIRTATAGHERYAGHDLFTGLGAPSTATPFSTDEQVFVARVFKKFISDGKAPTRDETRGVLTFTSYLQHRLLDVHNIIKKVQDFVRHRADVARHQEVISGDLNAAGDYYSISRTESSGLRRQWSTADSKVIEDRFTV